MKKIRFFLCPILLLISLASFTSCENSFFDYKPSEGFYRLMNVEHRARELKILNSSVTAEEAIIETDILNEQSEPVPLKVTAAEEYDVFVITDVHFGMENTAGRGDRREADWFNLIETGKNEKDVPYKESLKFVICLGDIVEHGWLSEFESYKENLSDPLEENFGIPIFNIVGNHDLFNSGWENWSEKAYPHTSFYKFETPSFSWYFIDSASGTLGAYQYDVLEKDMLSDSKQKFLFSHIPVYADNQLYFVMQNTEERNKLISTCAKASVKLVVDGHLHKEIQSDLGAFVEQTVASFLSSYSFAIIHVNEADKTFSISCKNF